MLTRTNKCKWAVVQEDLHSLKQEARQRAWLELRPLSRSTFLADRWCWSGGDRLLHNYNTAQLDWSLIQSDIWDGRDPLPPSWQLEASKHKDILKQVWYSPGVAPKTAAVGWRMMQRALPNADRWTGFLDVFDHATCDCCVDRPRNKSEHMLFHCQRAKPVWKTVDGWLARQEPAGLARINQEAALLGVQSRGSNCVPFRKKQWWPVLWLAVLFELWKSWAGAVYGGKSHSSQSAILCAIWERWIVSGSALALRASRRFEAKQWSELGVFDAGTKRWLIKCPWVRPHHGSEPPSPGSPSNALTSASSHDGG